MAGGKNSGSKSGAKAPVVPSAPAGSKDPAPLADEATLDALAAQTPRDDAQHPHEAVVARGHTVQTEHGVFTAGQKVRFADKSEVKKLRDRGVLAQPGGLIIPRTNGPQFYLADEAAKLDDEAHPEG